MRWLRIYGLCFVCFLVACAICVKAYAQDIYVTNDNPAITGQAFAATVTAIQSQLDNELEPAWGVTAHLVIGQGPDDAWQATVSPKINFFALGYHDFAYVPFAFVFSGDTTNNWQATLDHELLEMIVDPWIDRLVKSNRLWLVEVADPVEDDSFGKWVSVDGFPVLLSDFVYPAWYSSNDSKFDAYGHVSQAHQILENGFAYYWRNGWKPLYGRKHGPNQERHPGFRLR